MASAINIEPLKSSACSLKRRFSPGANRFLQILASIRGRLDIWLMIHWLNLVCCTRSRTPSKGRTSEAYSKNACDGPMNRVEPGVGRSLSGTLLNGERR